MKFFQMKWLKCTQRLNTFWLLVPLHQFGCWMVRCTAKRALIIIMNNSIANDLLPLILFFYVAAVSSNVFVLCFKCNNMILLLPYSHAHSMCLFISSSTVEENLCGIFGNKRNYENWKWAIVCVWSAQIVCLFE